MSFVVTRYSLNDDKMRNKESKPKRKTWRKKNYKKKTHSIQRSIEENRYCKIHILNGKLIVFVIDIKTLLNKQ